MGLDMNDVIGVQKTELALSELMFSLLGDSENGAIVHFIGTVRDLSGSEHIEQMFLEHYPGMTEKAMQKLVEQARERWSLGRVVMLHRVGEMHCADPIVFVGVTSAHRQAAFEAAQFMMDRLKRDIPFWKKEISNQREHWVEQKSTDLEAADRWQ